MEHKTSHFYYTSPLSHPYYTSFFEEHNKDFDDPIDAGYKKTYYCHQYPYHHHHFAPRYDNSSLKYLVKNQPTSFRLDRAARCSNNNYYYDDYYYPNQLLNNLLEPQNNITNSAITTQNDQNNNNNNNSNVSYFDDGGSVNEGSSMYGGSTSNYNDNSSSYCYQQQQQQQQIIMSTPAAVTSISKKDDVIDAGDDDLAQESKSRSCCLNNNQRPTNNYQQQGLMMMGNNGDQTFAYSDQLRHEFRLKQTEFATYAKKLRLVDATSAYYNVLADHLLQVQAELNELAQKMADCVVAGETAEIITGNNKHHQRRLVFAGESQQNSQQLSSGDSAAKIMGSRMSVKIEQQEPPRPISTENSDVWSNTGIFRTYGALQRKLLTSLDARFDGHSQQLQQQTDDVNNEESQKKLFDLYADSSSSLSPPPPPQPPRSQPPVDDNYYIITEQTNGETSKTLTPPPPPSSWCSSSSIAAQHLQHLSNNFEQLEDEMTSAVGTATNNGCVDTSSIYDALSHGGVALRRVVPTSPRDLFNNADNQQIHQQQEAKSAPKFSRISISTPERLSKPQTERYVPPSPVRAPEIEITERKGDLAHCQPWSPKGGQNKQDDFVNSRGVGLKVRSWDGDNKAAALVIDTSGENGFDDDQQVSVNDLKKRYESPRQLSASENNGVASAPHVNRAIVESSPPVNLDDPSLKRKGILKAKLQPVEHEVVIGTPVRQQKNHNYIEAVQETPSARKMLADQRYKFLTSRNNGSGGGSNVSPTSEEPVIEMESIDASQPARMVGSNVQQQQRGRFQFFLGTTVQTSSSSSTGIMYQKVSEEQDVIEYEPKQPPVTVRLLPTTSSNYSNSPTTNGRLGGLISVDETVQKAAGKEPFAAPLLSDYIDGGEKSATASSSSFLSSSAIERNLDRMEAPDTSAANLKPDHPYDELNVTSAITESDIEDFNEILDGTKAESERLSPAELARIDSLRSSLRSNQQHPLHSATDEQLHHRSTDEESAEEEEKEDAINVSEESIGARQCWPTTSTTEGDDAAVILGEATTDNSGRVADLSIAEFAAASPSSTTDRDDEDALKQQYNNDEQTMKAVELDTPPQTSATTFDEKQDDSQQNNENNNNNNNNGCSDESPITIHGLDEYELTKKRLSENLNTTAVHWKTRFSQSSPIPPMATTQEMRCASPKEAVRLLMEDDSQFDVAEVTMPPKKVNFSAWDARDLVRHIYAVVDCRADRDEPGAPKMPHVYVNMEGYLERLLHGGRQTSTVKTWRRKYIRLRDGVMYTSDKPSDGIDHYRTLQAPLGGAKVFAIQDEPAMFTVEEPNGRWNAFRCTSEEERSQWLNTFATQTLELPELFRYIQPLLPSVNLATRQLEDVNPKSVVIIDIGESSVRAGVLRNRPALPDLFFPATGAKVTLTDGRLVDTRLGEDAYAPSEPDQKVTLSHPFKMSVSGEKSATDFVCLSGLLSHVIAALGIDPSKFSLLLTIPFEIGNNDRVQLSSTVQKFGFSKHFVSTQEPLVLYAYGCVDAVVVHVGEHTSVMPVVAGCPMIGGRVTLPYGGHDLFEAFNATLPGKHICSFSTPKELLIVRYLAEHLCYVAENYEKDLNACLKSREKYQASEDMSECQLPEGLPTVFTADWGRFHAAEQIANPAICHDSPSIAQLIYNAIRACPIDSRRDLYRNIILSGGPSCLPGLVKRLEADLKRLLPSNTSLEVRVNRAPFAYHATFVGATVLAAKPEFNQLCSSSLSLWPSLSPGLK